MAPRRGNRIAAGIAGLTALVLLAAGGCKKPGKDGSTDAGAGNDSGVSPDSDAGGAIIVPEETADEESLTILADWRALPTPAPGHYLQSSSFDRGTGDPIPLDLVDNGNRDMNHFSCASDDAVGPLPHLIPFVFAMSSCPESHVRGFVMARVEGSGRMARFWLTALALKTGNGGDEIFRIYVDDGKEPILQVTLASLLDGSAGEIFAPPFGAGSGTHVAWYYPVVFAEKLIVSIDRLRPLNLYYHQTDVVLDPTPIPRMASSTRLPGRDAAATTLAALADGPVGGTTELLAPTLFALQPGAPTTIADLTGPGTLHEVRLRVAPAALPDLDALDLTVRWDDEPVPSMQLPLGVLFASALDPVSTSSLALAGTMQGPDYVVALRLPMPFATRAEWSITNGAAAEVTVEIAMNGEASLPTGSWLPLGVEYRETVGPTTGLVHPVASSGGPGRLVGACLLLEGHELASAGVLAGPLNFLEGDELITLDGTLAVPGTGTEDYLNASFYFAEGAFGTAFAQAWGIVADEMAAPPGGRVSACRWHVLTDAIDFASSLGFDLEIGPGQPEVLDRYRSVAFIYR